MALASNPFIVLSYVGGPALLTNASALLLLSTSNRFARAVDRSRFLTAALADGNTGRWFDLYADEVHDVARRLALIARALTSFYLAVAAFGLATLLSISGAAIGEIAAGALVALIVAAAAISGAIGFIALVTGAISLVVESRIAVRALTREADMAASMAKKTG